MINDGTVVRDKEGFLVGPDLIPDTPNSCDCGVSRHSFLLIFFTLCYFLITCLHNYFRQDMLMQKEMQECARWHSAPHCT